LASNLFDDIDEAPSGRTASISPARNGGTNIFDTIEHDGSEAAPAAAAPSRSLARMGLDAIEPVGKVISMPARGLGMIATEAQEALAGTPDKDSRFREAMWTPDGKSTLDTLTSSDVTSPMLPQLAVEGYKVGAQALAGTADPSKPGALAGEDELHRQSVAAAHPLLGRAEAIAEPVAEQAFALATDPTIELMGGLGKVATEGRAARAALDAGVLVPEAMTAAERAAQAGRYAAGAERALGAAFVPSQLEGAVHSFQHAKRAADEHGVFSPEALRAGVGGALELGMAGLGTYHAARGGFPRTGEPREALLPGEQLPETARSGDAAANEQPFVPVEEPLTLPERAPELWPVESPYSRQTAPVPDVPVDILAEREFLRPDAEASVNAETARLAREDRIRRGKPIDDAVAAAVSPGGPPRLTDTPESLGMRPFEGVVDENVRRRMRQGQTVEDVQREGQALGLPLPEGVDADALRIAGEMPGPPGSGRKWKAEEVAVGLPAVRDQLATAERPGVRPVRAEGQAGPGTGEVIGRSVVKSVKPELGLEGIDAGPKEIVEAIDRDGNNPLYREVVDRLRAQAEEQQHGIGRRRNLFDGALGDEGDATFDPATFDPEFRRAAEQPRSAAAAARTAVPEAESAPRGDAHVAADRQAPRYAFRVRDVGEEGVPSAGHAQATASEADVRRLAPSRSEGPQEIVRVDLSKLSPNDYEIVPRPGGAPWVRFKRSLAEGEVESRGPVTDIDRAAADKASPELAAAVDQMAEAPRTLAKRAGLSQVAVRKGIEDVRADGVRELSPEAVAVKRATLKTLERHGLPTEAGPLEAAYGTEAEADAARSAAHERAGSVGISLDLPEAGAHLPDSAHHPAAGFLPESPSREASWEPAGFRSDSAPGALGGDHGPRAESGTGAPASSGLPVPRGASSAGQLSLLPGQDVTVRSGGGERRGILIHTGTETDTTGPSMKGKAKVRLEDGRQMFVKAEDVTPVEQVRTAAADAYGRNVVQAARDQVGAQMDRALSSVGPVDTTAKPPVSPLNLSRMHLSEGNRELLARMYQAAPEQYEAAKGGRMTFDDFERQGLKIAGVVDPKTFEAALKNGAPLSTPGEVVLAKNLSDARARDLADALQERNRALAELGDKPRSREAQARLDDVQARFLEASLQKANLDLSLAGAQAQAARTLVAMKILSQERGPIERVIRRIFSESC
jgi:hypothetical protein